MAAINANIVVETTNLTVTPTTNNLGVTVDPISLNVFASSPQTNLPGGTSGQLQFNNGSAFGGLANSSVTSGTLTFTNLANLSIDGGTNGYVLQTDGAGVLSWVAQGGAGTGNPGGSNTQIQFNDAGLFGGDTSFTFDKTTDSVTVNNITATGLMTGDGGGLSNVTALTAGTVTSAVQPNITSTGTLTSLTVAGTSSIQQAIEKATLSVSPATGTINFDLLDQAIIYKTTNASGNFTLNIRGNASATLNSVMSIGESMTLTFINTNGSTAYYANVIEIDGTTITPKYSAGYIAEGTVNGVDAFTFNIIKTAALTFTVLGSKIGFS